MLLRKEEPTAYRLYNGSTLPELNARKYSTINLNIRQYCLYAEKIFIQKILLPFTDLIPPTSWLTMSQCSASMPSSRR